MYYQMEPEKGLCKLCNVEVEDEMHFLRRCSKLEKTRSAILNSRPILNLKYKNIPHLSTIKKIVCLMSIEDPYILRINYYTSREFPIQNFHRRTTDIL